MPDEITTNDFEKSHCSCDMHSFNFSFAIGDHVKPLVFLMVAGDDKVNHLVHIPGEDAIEMADEIKRVVSQIQRDISKKKDLLN